MRPAHRGIVAMLLTLAASASRAQVVLSPTHYDARFTLDYGTRTLSGTVRVTLRNLSPAPVHVASLLLYRLFQVRAVRDERGNDLPFTQSVVAFRDFAQQQVNQLLVALRDPLRGGDTLTMEVRYDGHLLGYAETGMRYIQDRIDTAFTILRPDALAYPEAGVTSYQANRAAPVPAFTYTARITVPRGFVVANGGRLDRIDTTGNTVTYRYSSLKPSWRMDFAVAKYGELSAASGVRVFYLPGDSGGAAGVLRAAEDALARFTRWFGARRDATALTFIEIPDGWGSQADVTAILQSAAAFRSARSHDEVYHEISHLWNVSAGERPSPRWEEGLASFLEDLVAEDLTGQPVVAARGNQLVEWLRGQLPSRPTWRTVPLVDYGRSALTDLSYSVGALYFHLVYRLAGRDAFHRIIGEYARRFAAGGGTTTDLADLVRTASTIDLGPLNDDWLFTTGWVSRVEQNAGLDALEASYRSRGIPSRRTGSAGTQDDRAPHESPTSPR